MFDAEFIRLQEYSLKTEITALFGRASRITVLIGSVY